MYLLMMPVEGRVWSWGSGTAGRLGHNSTKPELHPRMIERLKTVHVVQVSAGRDHSMALTGMYFV